MAQTSRWAPFVLVDILTELAEEDGITVTPEMRQRALAYFGADAKDAPCSGASQSSPSSPSAAV